MYTAKLDKYFENNFKIFLNTFKDTLEQIPVNSKIRMSSNTQHEKDAQICIDVFNLQEQINNEERMSRTLVAASHHFLEASHIDSIIERIRTAYNEHLFGLMNTAIDIENEIAAEPLSIRFCNTADSSNNKQLGDPIAFSNEVDLLDAVKQSDVYKYATSIKEFSTHEFQMKDNALMIVLSEDLALNVGVINHWRMIDVSKLNPSD